MVVRQENTATSKERWKTAFIGEVMRWGLVRQEDALSGYKGKKWGLRQKDTLPQYQGNMFYFLVEVLHLGYLTDPV